MSVPADYRNGDVSLPEDVERIRDLEQQVDEACAETSQWKANHDHQVELKRKAYERNERLRALTGTVVVAWTRWIDTRKPEWAYEPEDPATEELDEAVGALGRVAVPERYDA